MLKSVIKSAYHLAPSRRCSVPAPSIVVSAGGWWAIVGQLRGKGRDRVGAAEPEENISVAGLPGDRVAARANRSASHCAHTKTTIGNQATGHPGNLARGRSTCI